MPEVNACWCGDTTAEHFTTDYVFCAGCGSLRYSGAIELNHYTSSEEDGFYGRRYWDHYVPEVLGLPSLSERARSDLAGRAVHYLQRVLEYVGPGDTVLEIGCAPGSLAALAQQAGLGVTGIELGESVIERIRERFAVDVRPGPLERADISEHFDAVVMIDVLEHLPRPLETLGACADRLRGNGILVLQTPCYRGEGPDWPMLLPAEHLFLYTEQSARKLLRDAGFHPIEVGTSLFPHDMWIVASRQPTPSRREEPLADVPPLARALIELSRAVDRAVAEQSRLEADCAERDAVIGRQSDELRAISENARRNEEAAARLIGELEESRADQRAKESLIGELTEELKLVRADQQAKERLIVALTEDLEKIRADQSAKHDLIDAINRELEEVRGDQRDKESLIRRISDELAAVREDQQAKQALIDRMAKDLQVLRAVRLDTAADIENEPPPPR